MHCYARLSYWPLTRIRVPHLQRSKVREHRYGEGALPRWQDCKSTSAHHTTLTHSDMYQIDPKRAIPREEQERTSKIFVGGVSQEATEEDFTKFFKQFGRVVDATLMMDKETGRPRGFGFVTFDGDAAVDATLRQPLQILGKPIEVKRAQPRGNMRDDDGGDKKFGRNNKFNNRDQGGNGNGGNNNGGGYDNQQGAPQHGANGAMTPAMMAQYWQRMQQYFQQMQQSLAQQGGGGGMPNPMGGMNPMAMQAMQAQMMGGGGPRNTGSPNPQNMMGGPGGMNPMAMQAMMQGNNGNGGPGFPGSGASNQGTYPSSLFLPDILLTPPKTNSHSSNRNTNSSSNAACSSSRARSAAPRLGKACTKTCRSLVVGAAAACRDVVAVDAKAVRSPQARQ
jgi:RNA recognition motif-containing protein